MRLRSRVKGRLGSIPHGTKDSVCSDYVVSRAAAPAGTYLAPGSWCPSGYCQTCLRDPLCPSLLVSAACVQGFGHAAHPAWGESNHNIHNTLCIYKTAGALIDI